MINKLSEYLREQTTKLEELSINDETPATYKEVRDIADNIKWRIQDYLDDDHKRSLKEPDKAKHFLEQFPTYDAWYDAVEEEFSNRTVCDIDDFLIPERLERLYADFEDPSDVVESVMDDNGLDYI